MKLNGFVGKGTGKLGSSVFAVSGGEQIVRQYNPNVSNPNTDAQIEQRAKFKLLSQLAADLRTAIVFPKKGLVSARNQFIAKNIKLANYNYEDVGEETTLEMANVQLTAGSSSFPAVMQVQAAGGSVAFQLASAAPSDISRVVYVYVKPDANKKAKVVEIKVSDAAGVDRNFGVNFGATIDGGIVYAYGVIDKTTDAKNKYNSYVWESDATYAFLGLFLAQNTALYNVTSTSGLSLE